MNIIIADNQDITSEGLLRICEGLNAESSQRVEDKATLVERLKHSADAVVIIDYTLFDINGVSELLILSQRFAHARWVLFSDELSTDFLRQTVLASANFSVVLKDSPLYEIKNAIESAMHSSRYICRRTAEQLLAPEEEKIESVSLTPTEKEILKDIAVGMTTREIAEKRISSFHTINTHRKNIFRKLGVNNVHEATKYALRAGLVDSSDYYI